MSKRAPRGVEWSGGGSPPPDRSWRDLLSDAFDNFTSSRSREESPNGNEARNNYHRRAQYKQSASSSNEKVHSNGKRGKPFLQTSSSSLNGPTDRSTPPISSPSNGRVAASNRRTRTDEGIDEEDGFDDCIIEDGDGFEQFSSIVVPPVVSSSTPAPTVSSSPSCDESDLQAEANERTARRAQMRVIIDACEGYRTDELVPNLPPPKPPLPGSPFEEVEGEDFYSQPCQQCQTNKQECQWNRAIHSHPNAPEHESSVHSSTSASSPSPSLHTLGLDVLWSPAGIPAAHRPDMWAHALGVQSQHAAWQVYYQALLSHASQIAQIDMEENRPIPPPSEHPDDIDPLLPTPPSPSVPLHHRSKFHCIAFREILKDVDRTLPSVTLFKEHGGAGQRALQRLLVAFSLHRPLVGYCQSMSFLAAEVLLVFHNHSESLAFGVFATILERKLSYYTKSMLGCILDARVLRDMVAFFETDLFTLLSKHKVSFEHFASSWLLCFFVGSPLTLGHATRVWDGIILQDETVLLATGCALMNVHQSTFMQLVRPSSEQLMNVLTRLVGTTTSLPTLLKQISKRMASHTFQTSVRSLRQFHRHALVKEHQHLTPSRLRRLERATQSDGVELNRLWRIFLDSALQDRWSTMVTGVIHSITQFRIAIAEAVFPEVEPTTATTTTTSMRSKGRTTTTTIVTNNEEDEFRSGSEASRWKAAGVISALDMLSSSSSSSHPISVCSVCVPLLPRSDCIGLQTCPRCSWTTGQVVNETPSNNKMRRQTPKSWNTTTGSPPAATSSTPADAMNHPNRATKAVRKKCTCHCSCEERGVRDGMLVGGGGRHESSSSSSSSPSVFQRLFHFFDSSFSSHGPRGFLDFETFVMAVKFFSSDRVERLQSVFRMAGGGETPQEARLRIILEYSGITNRPSAAASASPSTHHLSHHGGIQRGRIRRDDFERFITAFEELYHGHALLTIRSNQTTISSSHHASVPPPAASSSPTSPPSSLPSHVQVSSSVAAARMFVDMAFEKEHAAGLNHPHAIQDPYAFEENDTPPMPPPTNLLATTIAPEESLSYESFASFILLHPLVAGFFRLDTIAD